MVNSNIKAYEPITGKVAGILTERELTINIGAKHGVLLGMKFKVLADPVEVIDPQTQEKLGLVDREKVRVTVTEVQEKFSICRTYRKWGTSGLNWLGMGLSTGERYETLKTKDSRLPLPLPEEDSYVKTGDRIMQLVGEEA